ncbi:hypothetical protein [Neptuniibacter sp. QD37_11]|uniref:hypothetical protein n=1 Tax=Neptuniibacter sp. QD37_11 TaxID=3398209 RepID=UPI0039F45C6A
MKPQTTTMKPVPFREGNTVLRTYETPFTDRAGHQATLTLVDYTDRKGKENVGFVLRVKWVD